MAGALLTSCSEDPNAVAANALCNCLEYNDAKKARSEAADAEDEKNGNLDATMKYLEEERVIEEECIKKWQEDYKIAKDDVDFRLALQEINKSVYKKASKKGIID